MPADLRPQRRQDRRRGFAATDFSTRCPLRMGSGRKLVLPQTATMYSRHMSGAVGETSQYWDLVPAIIGGVIGALAGGIPAWLLAKRQSDETLRRDQEQRRETEKSLAFRVSVKLLTIINNTISLRNHVQRCVALIAQPGNAHMELWQVIVPMVGFTDEGTERFDAEEMAVFAAADEHEFMMDAILVAQRHASSLASFLAYCQQRQALLAIAPRPQNFVGQMGTAMLTQEQVDDLKSYTLPLNSIAAGLVTGLEEDMRIARSVATNFGPITKKYFNVSKFVSLSFPSDEELAKMVEAPDTA